MNWTYKQYTCKCHQIVEFRYGYKKIQHKTNNQFVDVASGAAIVICTSGCSFWIPSELKTLSSQ